MLPHVSLGVLLVLASFGSAILAVILMDHAAARRAGRAGAEDPSAQPAVFLLRDRDLVDATGQGMEIFAQAGPGPDDQTRLLAVLSARFDGLADRIDRLPPDASTEVAARADPDLRLTAENLGPVLRLTLASGAPQDPGVLPFFQQEGDLLRDVAAAAPVLAWRLDAAGGVDWANRAYLDQVARIRGLRREDVTWPLPAIFDPEPAPAPGESLRRRVVVAGKDTPAWFEHQTTDTRQGAIHFALPVDRLVKAETALREFVQTLTKTFAHLPIGLAIFDRSRRIALFNPALLDLTTLGPDFLSSRPTLTAFFDALREARMIPEPKDYHSWRRTITDVERDAALGQYQETWTLGSGQTFHVSGRPHPDGAIAFLFEDITAEISLTRRFRTDIELCHEVMDHMPEAIAVISATGMMEWANAAYVELWGSDPASSLAAMSAEDALAIWQGRLAKGEDLGVALASVRADGGAKGAAIAARLTDGRMVQCSFARLSTGGVLARFRPGTAELIPTQKLRERLRPAGV